MMLEYYKRPEATREAFVRVGGETGPLYFKTGDTVAYDAETAVYTIQGRTSADIIKHKGYKISALDIENALLAHVGVRECAVVGMEHEAFGQEIVAVCVPREGTELEAGTLSQYLSDHIADYKVPQKFIFVDKIKRNAMGKVSKKELCAWIASNFS
mmetsp:Transcript_5433/g.14022  ORF Transcript_5433/g.14022 Transcript_5433/m.14022 type:complete len:156 (-) Transcript_5433:1215-1682(-)